MPASPVVASWELGRRLWERRDALGLTNAHAAKLVGMTPQWLSSVEKGKKALPEDRLFAMITAYDLGREEADELLQLREDASQRGWWRKYSAMFSEEILRMFGFEHGAESVRTYSNGLVTGLLQTEEYARAIIEAGSPNVRPAEVERRVEVRMRRQRRLGGADPLRLTAIMSEATIRQQVGGPVVLAEQLRHLIAMTERHGEDTLDLRVVPFTASGHPGMGGSSFYLMTFPSSELPTIVHQETVTSTDLITSEQMVREYSLAYAEVGKAALGRVDTLKLIDSVVKELP